ncbi:ATP-binding protein, partial [Frankia gtarii]|uniref:ATP-binding protein n=1 Tax=Frankia gtarii TaxID=2950102 RepID=UPI0021C0D024
MAAFGRIGGPRGPWWEWATLAQDWVASAAPAALTIVPGVRPGFGPLATRPATGPAVARPAVLGTATWGAAAGEPPPRPVFLRPLAPPAGECPAAGPGTAGTFVGRRDELALLARLAARAAAGRRQVAVVSGEAGIGKTYLCERAAEQAEQAGLRVEWGRCWPYGGAPPLWPWPAVLAAVSGMLGDHPLAEGLGGGSAAPERFTRFQAVAELLARRLTGRPTMIVLDDVHAADADALLLTRFLARALDRVPLLLVLTRRPDEQGDPTLAQLAADVEREATVLALSRFTLPDAEDYLAAHGLGRPWMANDQPASVTDPGGTDPDRTERHLTGPDLARTVLAITGGNPLFVSRVVAHGSPQPGLLGVEQAVAQSVDLLDADTRRTLALAAVLGRTVAVRDVAALADRPVDAVLEALADAQRAGLVEPDGADRVRFGHDVIVAAATATLSPRERLDAHAGAAALIGASNRADRLALRAHHALQAAARSDEDARRAVDACRAAARSARRGFDYQRAAALLDAAVAVSDPWPATSGRAALLVERAEAILACGRLSAARDAFAHAADAVAGARAGADDPILLARAALGLGGVWLNEHRDPVDRRRVLALQRAALDALTDPDPDPDHAAASGAAGDQVRRQVASLRGRLAVRLAAESVYDGATPERALAALAEVRATGDACALAEALSLTHHAMLGPEHNPVKLALAQELLTVAASAGEGVLALLGLLWRTVDLFHLGDARAERSLAELRARADALACQSVLYIVAAMDVMRLVRGGRLAEAETAAGACLDLGLAVGDADALAFYGAQLASIRWMQGRDGELLDLAAEAAASPTLAAGDFAFAAGAATMAARAGRLDEARIALHRLVPSGGGLATLPTSSSWLTGMVAVAEAACLLGERAIAEQTALLIEPFADLPVMPSLAVTCFGSAERALGLVALALGDADGAVRHHERALAANQRFGNRPGTALARVDLADALTARAGSGDRARARTLLAAAHAEAVAMDLPVRAAQWAALLHALDSELPHHSELPHRT